MTTITPRERVWKAIRHQQPDYTPYQIGLTKQAAERLTAHTGDPHYIEKIGNHLTSCYYEGYCRETTPGSGIFRDHFGVTWNRNGVDKDIGVLDGLVLPEPTLAGYTFPKFDTAALRAQMQKTIDGANGRFTVAGIGFSMFERAWTFRGMENILIDMMTEPEFVHDLLDAICEHNLKYIRAALEFPFDMVQFGDDWGQQKGLIMGPAHWRTFIKPRMQRMFAEVKRAGKAVGLHSCGDIHELFPDLIEMGLNVYQTFQPEIYDLPAVKKEFGNHLTFWGGISTQRALPWKTPEEIRQIARETIAIMGVNGGYIAAPTHAVPGDVPPENIIALAEVFQEQLSPD